MSIDRRLAAIVLVALAAGPFLRTGPTAAQQATPVATPPAPPEQVIATDAGRLLDAAARMQAMGVDMVNAAIALKAAAIRTGDADADALANHFIFHGDELYYRGKALAETADSLTRYNRHSPEVNVASLRSNGEQLEALGAYLVAHAEEMGPQVEQIRQKGVLASQDVDRLAAEAEDMVRFGDEIQKMGEELQDDARALCRSMANPDC